MRSRQLHAATAAQTLSKSSIVLRVAVGLNLWEGEQWDKDVLRSAVIGAGSGVLFTGIAEFQAYRGLAMSSRGLRPREGGFQLGRSAARAVDETSFSIRAQTEVTAQASANISASAVERLPSVTSAYSRQILRASQISF
ncbi:hypothetical protein APHAL10511_002934 [Amanita phalloides]|nr:hypothetical protein APHAL10511_002934 [Amanita phalloides]